MYFLPDYIFIPWVFILGLIIGSFLDVIVTRFHTGKSINGRSRCLSCGHTLSWYELFPLLSYIVLRGKCKNCEGRIPLRLLITELCTSLLFVYVALTATSLLVLFLGLILVSVLMVVMLYDYNHMVIPNAFVYAVGILALINAVLLFYPDMQIYSLIPYVLSACGAFVFYAGLWFVSKGRWIGFGDAKLAFVLGLFLTPVATFSMVVFSFWIGAGVSIMLLCIQHLCNSGQRHLPFFSIPLTMKSEVPFAPFMICSFILVYFGQNGIFQLIAHFL